MNTRSEPVTSARQSDLAAEVARLRREVAILSEEVARLREQVSQHVARPASTLIGGPY